jgi:hypothetical protein
LLHLGNQSNVVALESHGEVKRRLLPGNKLLQISYGSLLLSLLNLFPFLGDNFIQHFLFPASSNQLSAKRRMLATPYSGGG